MFKSKKTILIFTIILTFLFMLVCVLGLGIISINENYYWSSYYGGSYYYNYYSLYGKYDSSVFMTLCILLMISNLVLTILYVSRVLKVGRFYHIFSANVYQYVFIFLIATLSYYYGFTELGVVVLVFSVFFLIGAFLMVPFNIACSIVFRRRPIVRQKPVYDAQEQRVVYLEPSKSQPVYQNVAPKTTHLSSEEAVRALKSLKDLYEQGIINEEEYNEKRKKYIEVL